MKHILSFTCLLFFSTSSQADPFYSFSNLSISHQDWTSSTEHKTSQRDFSSVKIEGGLGYDWGEVYGNFSIDNPQNAYQDKSPHNQRYSAVLDLDIKLIEGFNLHVQDFYANGNDYFVNDLVMGVSTKYQHANGFWIKPFLGTHFTHDTYFTGDNGYMTGWVLNYPFQVGHQQFSVFQWNEIEFGRAKRFYEDKGEPTGDGKSYGINGAINLWWNVNKDISTGLGYRYAEHKLGNLEYQSAFIYSLRYAL